MRETCKTATAAGAGLLVPTTGNWGRKLYGLFRQLTLCRKISDTLPSSVSLYRHVHLIWQARIVFVISVYIVTTVHHCFRIVFRHQQPSAQGTPTSLSSLVLQYWFLNYFVTHQLCIYAWLSYERLSWHGMFPSCQQPEELLPASSDEELW